MGSLLLAVAAFGFALRTAPHAARDMDVQISHRPLAALASEHRRSRRLDSACRMLTAPPEEVEDRIQMLQELNRRHQAELAALRAGVPMPHSTQQWPPPSQQWPPEPATSAPPQWHPQPATEMQPLDRAKELMQKIKDAGIAGVISFALVQTAFWAASVPVVLVVYSVATGHWPDLTDQEDLAQFGAEAFAYVNIVRFAAPLRIGAALSAVPWVQANIVDRLVRNDRRDGARREFGAPPPGARW